MSLILPTAHYLGRSCQKTDGEGWRHPEDGTRLRERKQQKECGSTGESVTGVVHAGPHSPAAALPSQNLFTGCCYYLISDSRVTLWHGRGFWAMNTQVGSSPHTIALPHQPMSPCRGHGPAPPLLLPRFPKGIFPFYQLHPNSVPGQAHMTVTFSIPQWQ